MSYTCLTPIAHYQEFVLLEGVLDNKCQQSVFTTHGLSSVFVVGGFLGVILGVLKVLGGDSALGLPADGGNNSGARQPFAAARHSSDWTTEQRLQESDRNLTRSQRHWNRKKALWASL